MFNGEGMGEMVYFLIFFVFVSSPVSSWRNEMISRFASVVREVVLDEEIAEPKFFLAPGTG